MRNHPMRPITGIQTLFCNLKTRLSQPEKGVAKTASVDAIGRKALGSPVLRGVIHGEKHGSMYLFFQASQPIRLRELKLSTGLVVSSSIRS